MRVNQMYEERPGCDLVCFAEAVTRDPFLLVGRTPRSDFRLESLREARIGTVSEVPTPFLCLQEDLRRAGIDPATLNRVADRSMPDNMSALRNGALDVVQLFQPLAEELIASGEGHLWYAAADRGPCSYTSFYARRGTLAAKRDEMLKLVRALYRTQKWLHRQTPETLADVVAPYFPDAPRPLLAAALGAITISGSGDATRSCRAPATSVSSPVSSRAASSAAPRSRPRSTTASPNRPSPPTRRLRTALAGQIFARTDLHVATYLRR